MWYQGIFNNDKFEDECCKTYYMNGQLKYEGAMSGGKRNGVGILYTEKGKIYRKGIFADDKFIGKDDKNLLNNQIPDGTNPE